MSTPSNAAASPVASPDSTPKNDRKLLIVVVVLAIAGSFVVAYITYLTLRVKRRQDQDKEAGPFTGRVVTHDHPASQITPFAAAGPYSGMTIPRFKHKPGEDMRIAIRRPDGAWYFADSRVPFTPTGVTEIDVSPSPMSSRVSLLSSAYSHRPLIKHSTSSPVSAPGPSSSTSPPLPSHTGARTQVPIIKVPSPVAKPGRPEIVAHQNSHRFDHGERLPSPPSPTHSASHDRNPFKDPSHNTHRSPV